MLICDAFRIVGGNKQVFEALMTDEYVLDGESQRVSKIQRIPANGIAVTFLIFVKS